MYVNNFLLSLSVGLWISTYFCFPKLNVFVCFRISIPRMSGDDPGTRSKVKDVGLPLISCTVSVHEHTINLASLQSGPHPGGSRLILMPRTSHSIVAFSIPPVEVGAPSSRMILGSGRSSSDPFIENTNLLLVYRSHYRCPSYCCSVRPCCRSLPQCRLY